MHSHSSAKSLAFPTDHIPENFHLRNKRIKRPENRVKSVTQISPLKKSTVLHGKHEKGQKYQPTMINVKDLLLKPDIEVTKQAHEKLECYCNVCLAQNGVKIEPEEIPCDEFFRDFDFGLSTKNNNEADREFLYIIRRLMPKKNTTHTMRLTMPETLFFAGGFPSFLVHPGKDKSLKFVKDKEKLALHEIRKFFQEAFLKIEEEELHNSTEQNNQSQTQNQSQSQSQSNRKGSVDTSSHQTARELASDSIPSNVLDMLDPKDLEAKRKVRRRTTRIKTTTFTNQDVVIIKFTDDSTSILTDNEFEALMAKKKFDPYWRKVTYIQNFRRLARNIKTLQRVYFVLERDIQHPLFKRASKEAWQVKGHVPQASGQYIPAYEEESFERSIRETNEKDYCLYILMKIYHFMEITQGVRIAKMGGDFVKDDKGVIYLIDICRLHSEVIEVEKPAASPERKPIVYPVYDEKNFEQESEKRKEHVNFLVNMMKEKYANAKKDANFEIPFGREYEEDLSDKVFSFLYPEMPVKLSTILKTNTKHAEFKRVVDNILVTNNFRRKTRKYIGLPTEGDDAAHDEVIQEQRTLINFNERHSVERGGSVTARRAGPRENSFLEYSSSERTLPSIGHVELNRSISKGRIVYQPVDHKDKDKRAERTNSTPSLRKVVRGVGLKQRVSPISKRHDQGPTEPTFFGSRITVRRIEENNPPPTTERRENPRVGGRPSNPIKIEHLGLESSREKLTSKISPETYRKLLEPIKLMPSALLSVKSHDEISRNLMKNKH